VASFVNLMQLAGTLDAEDHPFIEVEGQEVACVTAFETAGSQAALFRLLAGQRIPAHTHSAIDDIFFGVRGTGRIRIWRDGGETEDHQVEAGTLVVVTPETPHEVSCAGDEFCYILLQAPREHYDNLPYP
jgi:quercetin dioxygenase-like cupin family protein